MKQKNIKNNDIKNLVINLAPILGLLLCILVFAVITNGETLSAANIDTIIKQFVIICLISIGAVFSFASGALDMSLSGSMCLSAVAGALAGQAAGSAGVMLLVCFAVSMGIALLKGIVAASLDLPVFIVTIVFSSVLSAIALYFMGNQTTITIRSLLNLPSSTMSIINVVFIAVFFLFALFLFNYTRVGKSAKLQGGNPLASGQSGINSKKVTIQAFLISGIGVTLAAFISMMSTKTVTAATGSNVGTNMMVALVLGGMPLSGGPRSRISAALVGAATITVLNNGLTVVGLDIGTIQIIRGIIFIAVAFLTSITYRTKLLPR